MVNHKGKNPEAQIIIGLGMWLNDYCDYCFIIIIIIIAKKKQMSYLGTV